MRFSLQKKPAYRLALEISSRALKLIELQYGQQETSITAYAYEPLPAKVIERSQVKDPAKLAHHLGLLLARAPTQSEQLSLLIPDVLSFTKIVTFAASLSDKDIETLIELEGEQYFNCPLNELYYDFSFLENAKDSTNKQVRLVAVKKERLQSYLEVLKQLGLAVKLIELESYAYQRVWQRLGQQICPEAAKTIAYGYCTPTQLELNLYKHNSLIAGEGLVEEFFLSGCTELELQEKIRSYMHSKVAYPIEFLSLAGEVTAAQCQELQQHLGLPVQLFAPCLHLALKEDLASDLLTAHAAKFTGVLGLALSRAAYA